ncbi:hypothetical protein IPL68_06505 [Candidatus Saccharibacteria bacterium]|nr:MAG: hypothetical protein IPL68_06505 [Candidatus Saccharibacteria bacterium]
MVRLEKKMIRPVVSLGFVALVAVFVWQNWETFGQSIKVIKSASLDDFWLAIPLVGLTFLLAVFSYGFWLSGG